MRAMIVSFVFVSTFYCSMAPFVCIAGEESGEEWVSVPEGTELSEEQYVQLFLNEMGPTADPSELRAIIKRQCEYFFQSLKNISGDEKKQRISEFVLNMAKKIYEKSQSLYWGSKKTKYAQLLSVYLSLYHKIDPLESNPALINMWRFVREQLAYQRTTPDFIIEEKMNEPLILSESFVHELMAIFEMSDLAAPMLPMPFTRDEIYQLGDPLDTVLYNISAKNSLQVNQEINSSFFNDIKYRVLKILQSSHGVKAIVLTPSDGGQDLDPHAPVYIVFIKTYEGLLGFAERHGGGIKESAKQAYDTFWSLGDIKVSELPGEVMEACRAVGKGLDVIDASTKERLQFVIDELRELDGEGHIGPIVILGNGKGGIYVQSIVSRLHSNHSLPDRQLNRVQAHTFQSGGAALYECTLSYEGIESLPITNHIVMPWVSGFFTIDGKGKHLGKSVYYDFAPGINIQNSVQGFFDGIHKKKINPVLYNHQPACFEGECQ